VARLLIILWEHELPVLRHAHSVETDDQLCDVLLDYARETLKVGIKTVKLLRTGRLG
jgi:hypothetical protein